MMYITTAAIEPCAPGEPPTTTTGLVWRIADNGTVQPLGECVVINPDTANSNPAGTPAVVRPCAGRVTGPTFALAGNVDRRPSVATSRPGPIFIQ